MLLNYESCRREEFNCLQLSLGQGVSTIEDSIRQYVASELLEGGNKYDAGVHGMQDARKFIRFKKLPPVLQVQVNRFDYDFQRDQMVKINEEFRFGETLDLEALLSEESNQS